MADASLFSLNQKGDRASLALLQDVLNAMEEGVALYDEDLRFVLCNERYMALAFPKGYPEPRPGTSVVDIAKRIHAEDFYVLAPKLDPQGMAEFICDFMRKCKVRLELKRTDGRFISGSSIKTSLGGYLLTFRDITAERDSKRHAQDMLIDAFQSLDDGLVLYDDEMRFVFANKAWEQLFYTGREMLKPGDPVFGPLKTLFLEGYFVPPPGKECEDYFIEIRDAIAGHAKQVPLAVSDGRTLIGSSHKTAFGGALMTMRDVTAQKKAERELEDQRIIAHQNEKLSALGGLLAGVAHELNNPLSVVFGYSQMLQDQVSDPVASKRIRMIEKNAERAAKIVKSFLAMARQKPTTTMPCSVNQAIQTAIDLTAYGLSSAGTQLQIQLDPLLPAIMGDFDQLVQVFTNLIVNAGQALEPMGGEGMLRIRSYARDAQGFAMIEIEDNGPGIPEENQSRVFEPFFTTKEVGEGTGIGLSFCHRIVAGHEGVLELESNAVSGTLFTVKLPLLEEGAIVTQEPVQDPTVSLLGKKILVLDDEQAVAQLVSDLLTTKGASVTQSTDPELALQLVFEGDFDAVVSDFKMPRMTGEGFFEAVRSVDRNLSNAIGFMTGDAMSKSTRSFLESSKRPFVDKPIIESDLIALVRQLCGTR